MTPARAAVSLIAVSALFGLGLAGCRQPDERPPTTEAPTPAAPAASPSLSRAELVAALALAASAHAAGATTDGAANLAGRTFSLRLPFGCFGPANDASPQSLALAGDGLASFTRAADGRSHQISLKPLDWSRSILTTPAGTAGADASPPWEAVDGFWIARPWLAEDVCPTPAASLQRAPAPVPDAGSLDPSADAAPEGLQSAAPARPAPFTAGLAAIRPVGGSRLGVRPGQTFSHTVRAEGEAALPTPAQGYRLVLEGRISRFPDGRAVRCTGDNPNRRPVCVVAVNLDRVAFETATGQRLSEWRLGGG